MAVQNGAVGAEVQSGNKVAFDHGLDQQGGRADVTVTKRALRKAIPHADCEEDAAAFSELFTRFVEQSGYTEGHHAVRVSLAEEEIRMLHLAHMVAADATGSWQNDRRKQFRENKRKLPSA